MKKTNLKTLLIMIAAMMLCLACLTACGKKEETSVAVGSKLANGGVLYLKVNPEIAITYDENGVVTKVEARNDDGSKILENYDDFSGKECRLVVTELVTEIGNAGYFIDETDGKYREITIEIESGSQIPNDTFLEDVVSDVRDCISSNEWQNPVSVSGTSDYAVSDYNSDNDSSSNYGTSDYAASDYGTFEENTETNTSVTIPIAPEDTSDYGIDNNSISNYGDTNYNSDNNGVSDYDDTDYGPVNDGASDYDDTDYGPVNDGTSDYDDTDYGPVNDGASDYDDTDYDSSDYGNASDYDDGNSDYQEAPAPAPENDPPAPAPAPESNPPAPAPAPESGSSDYDDGGSSDYDNGGSSDYDDGGSSDYDDGGSSDYDDGGSDYDDGGSDYDDGGSDYDD